MNICGGFLAPGNVQVATAGRARADEDRVPILRQQRFEAVHTTAAAKLNAEIEDVIAFLVDNGFREAEPRDLRADHAARFRVLIEDNAMVAERSEVARHCQRCGAAAHKTTRAEPASGCLWCPGEGEPNPARILLDPPSKFHRYVCHNSVLSPRVSTFRARPADQR